MVPEQVITEITGHWSDCVRTYKRTNDDIRKAASNTISGVGNSKCDEKLICKEENESKVTVKFDQGRELSLSEDQTKCLNESMSVCNMIKNVIRTRLEIRKRRHKRVS